MRKLKTEPKETIVEHGVYQLADGTTHPRRDPQFLVKLMERAAQKRAHDERIQQLAEAIDKH